MQDIRQERRSCLYHGGLILTLMLCIVHTGLSYYDDASRVRELAQQATYIAENLTLPVDYTEITGYIDKEELLYVYNLVPGDKCFEISSGSSQSQLLIALKTWFLDKNDSVDHAAHFFLTVNTKGLIPFRAGTESNGTTVLKASTIQNKYLKRCGSTTNVNNKATGLAAVDIKCHESYAITRVLLHKVHPIGIPWLIGVSSTRAPLNFSLRAWCLEEISIAESGNRGTILRQTLDPGAWKYFSFDVSGNKSRVLVEIAHLHGDMVLFLKSLANDDLVSTEILSEFNMDDYEDMLSFENRLGYLSSFTTGEGRFLIGVLNNDACIKETAYFNATITVALKESSHVLCPRNCTYPNGRCIEDNVCQCESGYGGPFCEGSLLIPEVGQKISGILNPGEITYIKITDKELQNSANLSIHFHRNSLHMVLLAKKGGFPTLTNYSFKFVDIGSKDNISFPVEEFKVGPEAFSKHELIFGVFNIEYLLYETSLYDVTFVFSDEKPFSSWVILLAALLSSLLVCLFAVVLGKFLQKYAQGSLDEESDSEDLTISASHCIEGSLKKNSIIERFPSMDYVLGIMAVGEAQCSICLSDYVIGDKLLQIPLCWHRFHASCIDAWLVQNSSCPLCRLDLGSGTK